LTSYRDGNRVTTFSSNSLIQHATYLNEQQDQIAAGFQTQWIDVPLYPAEDIGTAWTFASLSAAGLGSYTTASQTVTDTLVFYLTGHPLLRHECEIMQVRMKTGGTTATGGTADINKAKRYFGTPATIPDAASLLGVAMQASDTPYSTLKTVTTDHSGFPLVLDDDYQYVIEVAPSATAGNKILYGIQLQVQYPVTP